MFRKAYKAFISYSTQYKEWVEILHSNLERCLSESNQEPKEIFLDQLDISSGHPWVSQLQAGLGRSDHLVLVATPESLASFRVLDELEAFISKNKRWARGHLHIAFLVDTPLPPFLEMMQYVDFREHTEAKYEESLRKLLAGLTEQSSIRGIPSLPVEPSIPLPPNHGLPASLRSKLVTSLASLLEKSRAYRSATAAALGLESYSSLESFVDSKCAASAAIVWATQDKDATSSSLDVIDAVIAEFEDAEAEFTDRLKTLRHEIQTFRDEGPNIGLLRVWLNCVEQDHSRLVAYFQQKAEFELLDRVYIKLDLTRQTRHSSAEIKHRIDLDRPLGIKEILSLDPQTHPWITHKWVVLGDPGAGKTTLIRHLAASLARERVPRFVPILESLPLAIQQNNSILDRVELRLKRAGYSTQELRPLFNWLVSEGRILLLLDGLDEVPEERRHDAEAYIRDLSMSWPRVPIVVTSRPIAYRRPGGGFLELGLLPLDTDRQREFLARWFGRFANATNWEAADEAMQLLKEEPSLKELASNPLYLTLIALLIETGDSPDANRTTLYDQIFDLLLEGRHKQEPNPIPARELVHRALRYLGFAMTEENLDSEAPGDIEVRFFKPEVKELRFMLQAVPKWQRSLRDFLDDMAERTGILGPHDGPEAYWRFWHRTFREALASEALEARWKTGGATAILQHAKQIKGDESRWAEPYSLLAGRVEKPLGLLKALMASNRSIGLRALATARTLTDDSLVELLALTENRKERAEVYSNIARLVGDAEKSLLLLDRLRRRTRNGYDLFFLDLALKELARRYPGSAGAASDLRKNLFDHIPTPPDSTFRSWTTSDGRSSPLFLRVPAGSFRMGSDKHTGYTNEQPPHKVSVTNDFWLAAIPVTQGQYAAFDPDLGFSRGKLRESGESWLPVVEVSWYEAISFCRWVASLGPLFAGCRLPNEVEWEYACRAGTRTAYWNGNHPSSLELVAWYGWNSGGRLHRVGEKPSNPWGLHDMHGNVKEWMLDPWNPDAYRKRTPGGIHDPDNVDFEEAILEAAIGNDRVFRGGSYQVVADHARSAFRDRWPADLAEPDLGFRLLLSTAK